MGEITHTPLCLGGPLPAIQPAAAIAGSPVAVTAGVSLSGDTTLTDTTIAFAAPDTITDSNNGLAVFNSGDTLIVTGTASNNGTYVIDTVAAGTITLIEQTISLETAGGSVTLDSYTISFTAPDTITDSSSGFGIFSSGDTIEVTGTTGQDGTYVIDTAAAGTLTLIEQTITTEAAVTGTSIAKANGTDSSAPPSSDAIYFVSTVHCHVTFDGTPATVNDAFVPANTPMVFQSNRAKAVNVVKATGASDGTVYIHNVATR